MRLGGELGGEVLQLLRVVQFRARLDALDLDESRPGPLGEFLDERRLADPAPPPAGDKRRRALPEKRLQPSNQILAAVEHVVSFRFRVTPRH